MRIVGLEEEEPEEGRGDSESEKRSERMLVSWVVRASGCLVGRPRGSVGDWIGGGVGGWMSVSIAFGGEVMVVSEEWVPYRWGCKSVCNVINVAHINKYLHRSIIPPHPTPTSFAIATPISASARNRTISPRPRRPRKK